MWPLYHIFQHHLLNGAIFGKMFWTQNVCFDFLYKFFPKYFSFQAEFRQVSLQTHTSLHVKYSLLLSDFSQTWILSTDFRKILKYPISLKSLGWWAELFYKKGRTQTLAAILRMLLTRYKSLDTGHIPPDIIHARKTTKFMKGSNILILFRKQRNSSTLVAVSYNDGLLTIRATNVNVVITAVSHNFHHIYTKLPPLFSHHR
jgi:hypothetical protein